MEKISKISEMVQKNVFKTEKIFYDQQDDESYYISVSVECKLNFKFMIWSMYDTGYRGCN